jgi:hypothetical protein
MRTSRGRKSLFIDSLFDTFDKSIPLSASTTLTSPFELCMVTILTRKHDKIGYLSDMCLNFFTRQEIPLY